MIENSACEYRIGPSGFYEAFSDSPLIKAQNAFIGWDTNDQGQVTGCVVTADQTEWRNYDTDMSGGRCHADWCKPPGSRGIEDFGPDQIYDPAGMFGSLLAAGFANKRVMRSTLIEFAKIEDASWARRLLFAIENEWNDGDVET